MTRMVFVIAPENFRDEELLEPKKIAEKAGIDIVIASLTKENVKGMLGTKIKPDMLVSEVSVEEYDAITFIGGQGVEQYNLYEKAEVLELAKKAVSLGKLVGAICIAPRILAKAGVLKGKRITAFPDANTKKIIADSGGTYTGNDVEVDGKIITASGPSAARKFGEKIVKMIKH